MRLRVISLAVVLLMVAVKASGVVENKNVEIKKKKNAYATMMYMGTPRDYEFYIAMRVMLHSLSHLKVDADLVVIASLDVPLPWVQALYVSSLCMYLSGSCFSDFFSNHVRSFGIFFFIFCLEDFLCFFRNFKIFLINQLFMFP